MTNTKLERVGRIDKTRLSGEFYFASLLAEAERCMLLDAAAAARVQGECLVLLRERIEQYTRGESSSVTQERAQALMSSNLYTIGIALKALPTPEDAAAALAPAKLSELYRDGRRRLDIKLKTARLYYANVVRGMVATNNYAYNSTIIGGIGGFFKLYDPDLGADEVHITADYPLANPVTDLTGIEFIQHYLNALKLENDFCGRFAPAAVKRLLHCCHPHGSELIFNIFTVVLTCAVGCVLMGNDPGSLGLSAGDKAGLRERLDGVPRTILESNVTAAGERLCGEMGITGALLKAYITAALPELCAEIAIGIPAGRGFVVTEQL